MRKTSYTICYLDDEAQFLGLNENSQDEFNFKHLFELNGHKCNPFLDSNEDQENIAFFEYLNTEYNNIDLVVLDHKLSGNKSGWDVAKKIRENLNYDNIPVVILSAKVDRESLRTYAFEYGVDYFLDKSELGLKNCNDKLNEIFSLNSVQLRVRYKDLHCKIIDLEKKLISSKIKYFFKNFEYRYSSDNKFIEKFDNKKNIMCLLEKLLKCIKTHLPPENQKIYVKPLALSAALEMILNKDTINSNELYDDDNPNFIDQIVKEHFLKEFSKQNDIKVFFQKIGLKKLKNYKLDAKYNEAFKLIFEKDNSKGISDNGLMALYEIVNNSENYSTIIHFYKLFVIDQPRSYARGHIQSSFLDPILKMAIEERLISM